MMASARRLPEGDRYVRAGKWKTWGPMLLLGPDVHGSTLGVVGFGRIGQAVARRAAGFGMTILYHDVHRAEAAVEAAYKATFLPLEELLAQADFVSLHVNLTPETRGLMNAEKLGWMKPTAVLVNTSRGPVVDQPALADALRTGTIFAAALDVTDPEPIATDDPLLSLENCLVVPHIASASRATRSKMAEMAAANLLAGLRGERLPTPVNPEVYEGPTQTRLIAPFNSVTVGLRGWFRHDSPAILPATAGEPAAWPWKPDPPDRRAPHPTATSMPTAS